MAEGSSPAKGDVATKLLFENERVRIWEMLLEPGEDGELHEHTLDHILVQISGDRMAVVPHETTRGFYDEYQEADVIPGQYFYVERGGVEVARNIGQKTYHEILIELKD
ncbi:MAG: hypothetical protein ACQGVC_21805 [Myxococcota bacterium]